MNVRLKNTHALIQHLFGGGFYIRGTFFIREQRIFPYTTHKLKLLILSMFGLVGYGVVSAMKLIGS